MYHTIFGWKSDIKINISQKFAKKIDKIILYFFVANITFILKGVYFDNNWKFQSSDNGSQNNAIASTSHYNINMIHGSIG